MDDTALLERACQRISALGAPAFIKDSSLRFIAVNEAYARLWGLPLACFSGCRSDDLKGLTETDLLDDRQRRALVFGTDETVEDRDDDGQLRYRIQIERFLSNEDQAYVFVLYEPAGEAVPNVAACRKELGLDALGPVLDLLETGIGIFDKTDKLVYFNEGLQNHFESYSVQLALGQSLEELIMQAFKATDADLPQDKFEAELLRERAQERFRCLKSESTHAVEPMPDGRWVRGVSHRLDNGWLVLLRQDVTDQKIQEIRLGREVEDAQILRSAFADLPVGVYLRNSQGQLIFSNAAYDDFVRQDKARTSEQMSPGCPASEMDRFRDENIDVLLKGIRIERSDDFVLEDGRSVAALTRIGRISSPAGEPYIVGSISDVTRVRDAQHEAERLHAEVKEILQSLPVGVAILDRDMRIEYANRTLNEFWRLEGEEYRDWSGQLYRDFLAFNLKRGVYGDVDLDSLLEQRVEVLRGPAPLTDFELTNLNGRSILIDRMTLADGKILFTCVDITNSRRREQEAQEARAALDRHATLMQTATSAMSQGLLIIQGEEIAFCNDAVPELLDLPSESFQLGKSWRELLDRLIERNDILEQEASLTRVRALANEPQAERTEHLSLSFSSGRFVDLEVKRSGEGQYLIVCTDVTGARQRELELHGLLRRAEAADRAKSEFLANMSHEIRTPMNGVLGMAELLSKSDLDTRQKAFTEIILKSGRALMTIINDILDFSKIDASQMTLRRAAFDVVGAVEDVATLLFSSAADKDLELIVHTSGCNIPVLGDAGRFRQIVTNLIGNAIKFTETGHILVEVTSEDLSDNRVAMTLSVHDTGIGIPEDQLDRIFDKFSQGDSSSTRRHEGTGLGLAITAGLVDIFGGSIEVESQRGEGSTFNVSITFDKAAGREVDVVAPLTLRNAKVLIIDDNKTCRDVFAQQLSMWGFDGVAASNGEEGLAVLRAAVQLGVQVDALILDSHMPGMSGTAVAAAIRRDPLLRTLPIILLSSLDAAGVESDVGSLNVQAQLMKPIRAQSLFTTLVDVIRAGRLNREGSHPPTALPAAPKPTYALDRGEQSAPSASFLMEKPEAQPSAMTSLDVLVAEDNEVNRIVFTQILQSLNIRFRIVENGADAVAAWQSVKPDLILMDVSMPVMNGYQATRRIRELEAATGARVPIVGVTAHALESDRDLCLASGMDDYLSKPISPELLGAKIREWQPLQFAGGVFQG